MPRDLDELFAALAGPEGAKLEPDEFRELLGVIGVTTAAGLRIPRPKTPQPNPTRPGAPETASVGLPRLDDLLEHMDAEQLKSVAQRFDPAANATRKVEARKVVLGALAQPAQLAAVVRGLSPLEHALLSELKRRGGVADGFSLVVAAALRGFAPAAVPGGHLYGRTLVPAPGIGFLARALRDGLVLPASAGAPWFAHFFGPGGADPDDSLVFADPRLLAALPDAPLEPPPEPLELTPVAATVSAPHPFGVVLELLDTALLAADEGGVQLTQSGAVAKPFLNRLKKRRPDAPERLERSLYLGLRVGLFDRPPTPAARAPWPVNAARLRNLQAAPLALGYALVLEAALGSDDLLPDGAEVEPRPFGLTPESVAGRALLECLGLLSDAPVGLADALDALWARALNYLYLPPYVYRGNEPPPARPVWLTEALFGLHALGLVGVAEITGESPPESGPDVPTVRVPRDGQISRYVPPARRDRAGRYALGRALGLELYGQARALQAEAFAALRAGSPLPAGPAPAPSQPALLIGPNFDVLVYLGDLTPGAVAALGAAELRRLDPQTAGYTLTRARFYRALELGFSVGELLGLLGTHSRGVPENVASSLRDWAARRERLRVRPAVTLLEYPDRETRDAALALLASRAPGAEAVAERFVRTASVPTLDYRAQHRYDRAPARTLRFSADGSFQPTAPPDLPAQAVLARFARQDERGAYHLDTEAVRGGGLTTAAYDTLAARALGGLPPQLETLLSIWRGTSPAPALARVSVFSHPNAPALARHPRLAPLLGEALNGSSYLVAAGQEDRLAERLKELSVAVGDALTGGGAEAADAFETGLPTRRLRERLEAAVTAGKRLELRYHREVEEDYGAGGARGGVRTEQLVPESVYYRGSTPYLEARTLEGRSRYVRVGYIVGYREL